VKKGDLVRLKSIEYFKMAYKVNFRKYASSLFVVLEKYNNAIKVMDGDGNVHSDLADSFEVISEV